MSGQTTTFKIRFTDRLTIPEKVWATIVRLTEEQAQIGKTAKFFLEEFAGRRDPEYVALAQARALQSDGGFYLEDGQLFLKIKCRRAFDLKSAYSCYLQNGHATTAFPIDRIDEGEKRYHSVRSLKPLIFTPSFQYGTIREEAEAELRRALLADDFVAKDILIHCFPGLELACPFYVMFKSFVVKVGAAGEDDQTSDLFYDVVADKVTTSSGRVEVPRADQRYFFLKVSDLFETGRFRRFQEIRDKLVFMEPDRTCLFVTHDWQTPPLMPDPHNSQYEELAALLKGDSHKSHYEELTGLLKGDSIAIHSQQAHYRIGTRTFMGYHPPRTEQVSTSSFAHVWYDYSCMPQRPRDHDDEMLFREQLANLNNIFQSGIKVVQIGNKERQRGRSWCVLEQELAKRNGGINMAFEGELTVPMAIVDFDAVFALSAKPLHGTQVTEADDRQVIEWMLYKSITDALTT